MGQIDGIKSIPLPDSVFHSSNNKVSVKNRAEQSKNQIQNIEDCVKLHLDDEKKKVSEFSHTSRLQVPQDVSRKYFVDKITGKIGVRIIDGNQKLLKQIPPEYQLAISRYMKIISLRY